MRFLKALLIILPAFFGGISLRAGEDGDDGQFELERRRYLQTVERMKVIMQGCEAFNTDNNSYPPADTIEALKNTLTPDYVPADALWVDGWNQPFRVVRWDEPEPGRDSVTLTSECTQAGPEAKCKTPVSSPPPEPIRHWHLIIASAGAEGKWEKENVRSYRQGWTISAEEDLVMQDGEWLRRMKPAAENWRAALDETRKRLAHLALALQAFATDNNALPDAENLDALVAKLIPEYLKLGFAARFDGWGNPLRFLRWRDPPLANGSPGRIHYRIASAGKDGRFEHDDLRAYGPLETIDPRQDLVIEDDHFLSDCLDPELNNAGRARMTMRKLTTLAMKLEQFSTEHGGYPTGDDLDAMMQLLRQETGFGIERELMRYDGWRKLLRYTSWGDVKTGGGNLNHYYCLASAGPDSKWEFGTMKNYFAIHQPSRFDSADDIVICNGQYARQPID